MRRVAWALGAASIIAAGATTAPAQRGASLRTDLVHSLTPTIEQETVPAGTVTRYKVRGDFYMYSGSTGNTLVFEGHDGVVVVDPQGGQAATDIVADVRRSTPTPIRLVIDTGAEPARLAGNQTVAAAGATVEGTNVRPGDAGGAQIWAHESVLLRLAEAGGDGTGMPTNSYFVERKDITLGDVQVALLRVQKAHANGDSLVLFERQGVMAVGDVFNPERYPRIELAHGGSINGVIAALNQIIRITVPAFNQEGGTLVIPASGRICDEADVAEYRDMVTIIRDRVQDLMRKHMSLAQIQAAHPSIDYDPRYGKAEGAQFVETIYRSLSQPADRKKS